METLLQVGLGNALLATALAVVAAGVGRLWRRPALVRGLWLLVLLKLVTPPLWPVAIPWPADPEAALPRERAPVPLAALSSRPEPLLPATRAPASEEPANLTPDKPESETLSVDWLGPLVPGLSGEVPPFGEAVNQSDALEVHPRASCGQWLAGLWLAGSAAWLALVVYRLRRFRRVLSFAWPAPPEDQDMARRLAGRLGLGRCPGVWLLPFPIPPLLWALGGPARLLVPEALRDRLSREQRETLLAHELAHLRRRDHWVRWLELMALDLYWWHPVAWWARRAAREAEEQCCDAWVTWALPEAAVAYAAALLETVAFLSQSRAPLPLAASGAGQVFCLKRRLTMIVCQSTPRGLGWAGALALLGLAAVLLPLWPTWAQTPVTPSSAADAPPTGPALAPVQVAPANGSPYYHRGLATSGANPERLRDAQDEVDLLKVQLEGKKAEVLEAQALLEKARRSLARQERLHKSGALEEGLLEQARSELAVQEARLKGKEAQLKEGQLRLRQAERRLTAIRGHSEIPTGAAPAPAAAVPPPHIGTVEAVLVPGDTTAPATTPAPVIRGRVDVSQDMGQRMRDLEKKVAALQREVEALRKEMRSAPRQEFGVVPKFDNRLEPSYTIPAPAQPKPEDPRKTPTVPLGK